MKSQIFQSTLPYGSEQNITHLSLLSRISIHAPLRERNSIFDNEKGAQLFQSTLPYGSDQKFFEVERQAKISIHAPLRERGNKHGSMAKRNHFNPRSLTGATFLKALEA